MESHDLGLRVYAWGLGFRATLNLNPKPYPPWFTLGGVGGETDFPALGFAVTPKKGTVLLGHSAWSSPKL